MGTSPDGDPPNVVVIYTDDQPREWVGCYGGGVLTPNVDRLAAEGMRFDRYYAASPVCCPSRYNALTGRYASRSRRLHEAYPAEGPVNIGWEPGVAGESRGNVASALSARGYTTGFVGKWHQGVDAEMDPVADDADPRHSEVEETLRRNYRRVVEEIAACGFDEVGRVFSGTFQRPEALRYHNQEWVTEGAVQFIRDRGDDGEPFFLYVAPNLPHDPWEREQVRSDPRVTPAGYLDEPPDAHPPRESVLDRVEAADLPHPGAAELAGFMTVEEVEAGRAYVTWLDDGVGEILDALDARGLQEETLVVFTSDHGNRGKLTCYDTAARQPCVVRWPAALDPRAPCERLASNVDLAPTVLDIAGVDPETADATDGRSLAPLLTGEGSYERESVFLEVASERAVVTRDGYKYLAVRYPPEIQRRVDSGEKHSHWCVKFDADGAHHTYGAHLDFPHYFDADQLYDLDADPLEQTDLSADPDHAERLEEMKRLLATYSTDLPHEFGEFT